MKTPKVSVKRGGRGRWLKVILGFAMLIGAALVVNANFRLIEQGYTPTAFSAILPYVLGIGSLICFVWVRIGKKGAKSAPSTTLGKEEKTEDLVEDLDAPTSVLALTVIRRCEEKDCPVNALFNGRSFCSSNGDRPEVCRFDEATFRELFSPNAYLNT